MKLLRTLCSVILTILLLVSLLVTGVISSVRRAYSEETLSAVFSSIEWSDIKIPYQNRNITLLNLTNKTLNRYSIEKLTEKKFNKLISSSAAADFVSDTLLDTREWLFQKGTKPELTTKSIAKKVVDSIEELLFETDTLVLREYTNYQNVLSLFPKDVNASLIVGALMENTADRELDPYDYPELDLRSSEFSKEAKNKMVQKIQEKLENTDDFVDAIDGINDALDSIAPFTVLVSVAATVLLYLLSFLLAVIIVIINKRSASRGLCYVGIAALLPGIVFMLSKKALDFLPLDLLSKFNIPENPVLAFIEPLTSSVYTIGFFLAAGGVILFTAGIILHILFAKKEKSDKHALAERSKV